ncbi:MAG: YggS family pyridoxal phosphate-dependent enzyme [Anaerolineae bacterium]
MTRSGGSSIGNGNVAANLEAVKGRIAEAALRAGRAADDVCLVAVTKTFPVEVILEAWEAGQRHFGENRPEEGAQKIPLVMRQIAARQLTTVDPAQTDSSSTSEGSEPVLPIPIWHMIGHVQSRKTEMVAAHFDIVHSLDRLKIARRLSRLTVSASREIPALIECNVSGEDSKYGYSVAGWEKEPAVQTSFFEEVKALLALPGLRIEGLMTVAPISDDPEDVRPFFSSLRGLRDLLSEQFPEANWHHLSMGMTDDFEIAVEEGATLVRVGRAIFGPRSWV